MDITEIPADVDAAAIKKQYAEVLHLLDSAVCTRCKGTGKEPTQSVRYDWLPLMQETYEAGLQRETYSKARSHRGQEARQRAYRRIQDMVAAAREIDLPQPILAIMAGISRAQLNNIHTGRAGERNEVVGPPENVVSVSDPIGVPRFDDGSRAGALAG